MSLFILGILTTILPSLAVVAWLVWRADVNEATQQPVARNIGFPASKQLR
jgi:hypothetical protein